MPECDLLPAAGGLSASLALWVFFWGCQQPPQQHVGCLSPLVSLRLHWQCPAPALPSPRVPSATAISIHVVGPLLSLSRLSGQSKEICPSKNENHLSQGSSSLACGFFGSPGDDEWFADIPVRLKKGIWWGLGRVRGALGWLGCGKGTVCPCPGSDTPAGDEECSEAREPLGCLVSTGSGLHFLPESPENSPWGGTGLASEAGGIVLADVQTATSLCWCPG